MTKYVNYPLQEDDEYGFCEKVSGCGSFVGHNCRP